MAKSISSEIIIKAKNLSAGYGNTVIWSNANFSIKRGEFVGVLGPNGAGKTTLLRLLLGLSQPMGGQLTLFDSVPKRGNARIGYVPQRRPIEDEIQVAALELVRLGISGTRWGIGMPSKANVERAQAMKALIAVNAEDLAERPLGALSGGELQRVFLAQALVGRPELLLLDEPLANLDVRREVELVRLIASVAKAQNVAVLLIAHDINPLLPVVDRLLYAVNGQLATGIPKEIITSDALSKLYNAPVEVLHDSKGRVAVLGTEEAVHHD
jgi:zinc/manganese transport system ATP-binding protein